MCVVGEGEVGGNDLISKFAKILWWQDKPLWVELKTNYYYITTLSSFHFFRNSQHQHPEKRMFLLRIYLGNVNVSLADILKFKILVLEKNF